MCCTNVRVECRFHLVKTETKSFNTCRPTGLKQVQIIVSTEHACKTQISSDPDNGCGFVLALRKERENPSLHSPMYHQHPNQILSVTAHHRDIQLTSLWLQASMVLSELLGFCFIIKPKRSKNILLKYNATAEVPSPC